MVLALLKGRTKALMVVCIFTMTSGKSKQVIFSVKAGEDVNVAQVRDLRGVLEREKAVSSRRPRSSSSPSRLSCKSFPNTCVSCEYR